MENETNDSPSALRKISSILMKIFLLPGKIFFPLAVLGSSAKKGTKSVLMAKTVLSNAPMRKSGEFAFSLFIWAVIFMWISPSSDEKKQPVSKETAVKIANKEVKSLPSEPAANPAPMPASEVTPAQVVTSTQSSEKLPAVLASIAEKKELPKEISPAMPVSLPKPTFDCERATNRVEVLICSHEGLISLDNRLNSLYEAYNHEDKKAEQIQWIRQRNRCRDVGCIRDSYEGRIQQLENRF